MTGAQADAVLATIALRVKESRREAVTDEVAVEEPLELRLLTPQTPLTLGVLMRTPGQDRELLLGWLLSEGLWPSRFDLNPDPENANLWTIQTPEHVRLAVGARLSVSSSACGVCGSGSIERLAVRSDRPVWQAGLLSPALITDLPGRLRRAQTAFARTGGLHAAGLFTAAGDLLHAAEDVGRHNAVDKVVGWAVAPAQAGTAPAVLAPVVPPPLTDRVLCVSSRAGFEIVQKAVTAGIAVVVTVGAASSLAVLTAQTFGVTLCAFTREGRFTVYASEERIGE